VILLDTHSLIWWARREKGKLTAVARTAIEAEIPGGEILVSSITAWELALLVSLGRLTFADGIGPWLHSLENIPEVSFVPVDNVIGLQAVTLPGTFHKDPADRIIVATARKFGAAVVTADEKIRAYPHVRTIW
jgi:PIN domain nuclease of toxin-antitoxin system